MQGHSASKQDAGVVGVGDEPPAAPGIEALPEQEPSGVSMDMLTKPLPGQHRPPCQKPEVEIKGGCWVRMAEKAPPCGDRYFEWNKECYLPVFDLPRPLPNSIKP